MTIIIGTDLSNASAVAADVAAELARHRREDLLLASLAGEPRPTTTAALVHESARLGRKGCRVRVAPSRKPAGSFAITQLAADVDASVIVLAGDGEAERAALAAVSQTSGAILVVRNPLSFRGRSALRLLVPFAINVGDEGLRDALDLVASVSDCEADFVHYATQGSVQDGGPPSILDEYDLQSYFDGLPFCLRVRSVDLRAVVGPLDEQICELAKERGTDLVVCGSRHRSGAARLRDGSTAEAIVASAPVSVLVARAPLAVIVSAVDPVRTA